MNKEYSRIAEELKRASILLVAVSKTKSTEEIMELYVAGQRDFGENRVQELREKYELLPKDIRWHLIGHLQTNKVKYIAGWVHLIHSVDRLELLQEINRQGEKAGRVIECLLQVYIAKEETKFGLSDEEMYSIFNNPQLKSMKFVRLCGLMGMATNTNDESVIRQEFRHLKNLFEDVKRDHFSETDSFKHLSMGMSSDYKIAGEEGSTMVRIGSLIFGERTN